MRNIFGSIDHTQFKVGDVFYEGKHDAPFTVTKDTETSVCKIDGIDRIQWRWKASCPTWPDREVDYLITEGLEHYGPKIYSRPMYVNWRSSK